MKTLVVLLSLSCTGILAGCDFEKVGSNPGTVDPGSLNTPADIVVKFTQLNTVSFSGSGYVPAHSGTDQAAPPIPVADAEKVSMEGQAIINIGSTKTGSLQLDFNTADDLLGCRNKASQALNESREFLISGNGALTTVILPQPIPAEVNANQSPTYMRLVNYTLHLDKVTDCQIGVPIVSTDPTSSHLEIHFSQVTSLSSIAVLNSGSTDGSAISATYRLVTATVNGTGYVTEGTSGVTSQAVAMTLLSVDLGQVDGAQACATKAQLAISNGSRLEIDAEGYEIPRLLYPMDPVSGSSNGSGNGISCTADSCVAEGTTRLILTKIDSCELNDVIIDPPAQQ